MNLIRHRLLGAPIAILLLSCLTLGCADRIWPSTRGVRGDDWLADEPHGNWSRSRIAQTREWKYNHPSRQQGEPGTCIAFSGGGLRSASFAIGVLTGLHEKGILPEIDRASSVSGGGYGLSWYLVHHYDAWRGAQKGDRTYDPEQVDRALFDDDGAQKQRLQRNMDIIAHPQRGSLGVSTIQGLTALLATIPLSGLNLLANGVFGWHANVSPLRRFYQSRIERVFHYKEGDFTTALVWDFGRTDEIQLDQIQELLGATRGSEQTHLPFPIFVTAANLNHTSGSAAQHVANRLFELTPEWSGSDAFGYRASYPLDVHKAVAVSGAAVDAQVLLSGPPSMFASMLDMDLGYHIDNPLFDGSRFGYRLIPFPAYFGFGWQNDQSGVRIHLTDGGHAENLGAFPLFRRLCRQTIIVDGTYDPNLVFDDYRVLRDSLRGELNLTLEIEAIDQWVTRQVAVARVIRALRKEEETGLDYRRRLIDDLDLLYDAWVPEIRASYDKEALSEETLDGVLAAVNAAVRAHLDQLRGAHRGVPRFGKLTPDMGWLLLGPDPQTVEDLETKGREEWPRVLAAQITEGELTGLRRPGSASDAEAPALLRVFYVKLSLPRDVRLDRTRCSGDELGEDACRYTADDFPQESTGDLSFAGDQFLAYRSLGRQMAKRFCLGKREDHASWFEPDAEWSWQPIRRCSANESSATP